jgi:hypothetical protein
VRGRALGRACRLLLSQEAGVRTCPTLTRSPLSQPPKSERSIGGCRSTGPQELRRPRCLCTAAFLHSVAWALLAATRKATLARTVEVVSSAMRTRSDVAYGRIPPGAEPFMAGTGSDETTRISWMQKPATRSGGVGAFLQEQLSVDCSWFRRDGEERVSARGGSNRPRSRTRSPGHRCPPSAVPEGHRVDG